MVVEVDGSSRAELRGGRLVRAWTVSAAGLTSVPLPLDLDPSAPDALVASPGTDPDAPQPPLPKAIADELACVASWLEKEAARIRVVHADASPTPRHPSLPSFQPTR